MPNDIITNVEHKPLTPFQQTYHWRNKNCSSWAQDWVKRSLPGLKVEEGGALAEIKEVSSVSGDCDLGQRKGKLLTIYDLEIEAKWEGKTAEGEDVTGTLRIPEFSHEAIDGLSDYVFEFTNTAPSNAGSSALVATMRKAFPPVLIAKLNSFRSELLEANGIFSDTVPSSSGTSTPGTGYSPAPPGSSSSAAAATAPAAAAAVKEEKPKKAVTSTTVVEVEANLQASADDIWSILTDPSRIPMWTRAPAKMELQAGAPFELFDGNIRGKVESFDRAKKLVQSWQVRKSEWPADHFGSMTITLDQGSDSTATKFTLEGVPTGQEGDIEKALDTFYIRGLKQMGLGTIL